MFRCPLAEVWSCSDGDLYAIQAVLRTLSLFSEKLSPASCKSYKWAQTKSIWDSSPVAIFALGTHSMRITCTERVANCSRTVAAARNSWQSRCQSQRIWNASTPSGWSTPLVLMQMTKYLRKTSCKPTVLSVSSHVLDPSLIFFLLSYPNKAQNHLMWLQTVKEF